MSQINSTTLQSVIALFKATEKQSNFNVIRDESLKAFDGQMLKKWDELFEFISNAFPKPTKIDDDGWRSAKSLMILDWQETTPENRHMKRFSNPDYENTAPDYILKDFFEYSLNSLYPSLIANGIRQGTLKISYKGNSSFMDIFPVLVENYIEIRRELYEYKNATHYFRFLINWAYGQLGTVKRTSFLISPDSECPLHPFYKEYSTIIKGLNYMHYAYDEVFVKTAEDLNNLSNAVLPVIQKYNLQRCVDIEYHQSLKLSRLTQTSHYSKKRRIADRKLKQNKK